MLLILGVLVALAQAPAAADSTELARLENVWNEAQDIVVVVPGMRPLNKGDAIGIFRTGRMTFDRYETSDTAFRVYGSTAVVTGRIQRSRVIDGRAAEDDWRFTKVYIRRDNRWQVVSFHASNTAS